MPDEAWIQRFDRHLASERRLAELTRRGYLLDLHALTEFMRREGVADWSRLTTHHIRRFVGAGRRAGLASRTLSRRLSAIRTFYGYLIREGAAAANPAADVRPPKGERRLPKTLDPDEMAALLDGNDHGDPILVRDNALFELIYSSGLRLAESVALNLSDVDRHEGVVRVLGKGAKERVVPVGGKALGRLAEWLSLRGRIASSEEQALFVGRGGKRLSPRAVQQRLRQLAERRGVGRRVNPHALRHSFATHLLESSGELRAVQELLGHADVSTTQVYTHLDFQHLAHVYDKAHPRARRKGGDRGGTSE